MIQSIEEKIKNSACFGVAFDSSCKECKDCDVPQRCEARCRENAYSKTLPTKGEIIPPMEQPPKQSAKTTVKPKQSNSQVTYDKNMPDLKTFSMEELEKLMLERKCGTLEEFEKYTSPQIRRMRIVMALKKSYEI